ncbi:hypothetical protein G159_01685 [Planococcus glaciei CHR43]|nr:hypothetical protein G159_01685 [Planococcus glaciei CHR43]
MAEPVGAALFDMKVNDNPIEAQPFSWRRKVATLDSLHADYPKWKPATPASPRNASG